MASMLAPMSTTLSTQLTDGEYVLWQGKPPTGILFRNADIFLIPFSLLWGGFAIFWEAAVLGFVFDENEPDSWLFALWGVPFVVIGLYLIFGRFLWDAFIRGRTEYMLTNRRALIATTIMNRKLRSFQLSPAAEVTSSEQANGFGSVMFGSQLPTSGRPNLAAPGFGFPGQFVFERIPRVGDVMSIISRIQSGKA
jgi:hypothetical protein